MPSLVRQRRFRPALEWALRGLALVLLAAALWRAVRPRAQRGATAPVAAGRDVDAAIARWSMDSSARDVAVRFDSVPTPAERDGLAALAHAGRRVRWSAEHASPVAVATEAEAMPGGGTRVRVASTAPRAALADAAGALDTLATAHGPATYTVAGAASVLAASAPGTVARAAVPRAARLGRVLVLGRAGWEAKFVVAALEEAGWTVDARIPLAPSASVTQGSAAPPDTARDAAVVALDSTALSSGSGIAAYVRNGGGLVLAGEASALPAFAALAAGSAGASTPGLAGAFATDAPRRALTLRPILRARADAVPVETRGPLVAAAARRVGAGRVLQLGYDDSRRWRMEGDDDAPAAHRAWWSRVVASVAYAPLPNDSLAAPDGAPFAHAVDALGPPSAIADARAATDAPDAAPLPLWMLFLSLAALVAEWASRRLRGAR